MKGTGGSNGRGTISLKEDIVAEEFLVEESFTQKVVDHQVDLNQRWLKN
jgi:hypothetical protein